MTIMNMDNAFSYLKDGNLVELGACLEYADNTNKSNSNGENLLHLAVIYCKDKYPKNKSTTTKQIFELLIKNGVSVKKENHRGETPLTIARRVMNISNQAEIIAILKVAEAKAEADQAADQEAEARSTAREKEAADQAAADQAADQEAAAYQEAQEALDNAARTFQQKSGVVTLQNKIEAVSNVIVKLHKVNTTEWQLTIIGQEEDKMRVSSLRQAQQAELKAQRVEQKVVEDIKKDDLTDLQLSHELKKALGRLQKVETTNEWLKSEVTNVLAAAAKAEAQQKAAAKQAAEARSTAQEKETADQAVREKETAGQAAAQIQKLRTPPPPPSMKKNQAANSCANSIAGRGEEGSVDRPPIQAPKPQPHRFAEKESPKDAAPEATIAARVAAQQSAARSAPLLVARVVAQPSVEAKAVAEATETSNKNARKDTGGGSLDRPPPTATSKEKPRNERGEYDTALAIQRTLPAPASGTAGASTGCFTPFAARVSSSCTSGARDFTTFVERTGLACASGARGFATFVERTGLACASSAGNCISFVERVGAACDSCISALESL